MVFLRSVVLLISLSTVQSCTDFALLIDGASKSFQNDVDLAVGLISELDISSRGHRLSIVEFGAKPAKFLNWPKFLFKHIKSTPQAISVLRRLQPQDGPSEGGRVLEIVVNDILPLRQSPGVPFVVLHLSDGNFNKLDPLVSILSEHLALQPNIYLYSVSTGSDIDTDALTAFSAGNRNRVITGGDVHSKALNVFRQFFKCDIATHEETLRRKPKLNSISDSQTTKTTKAPVTKQIKGKSDAPLKIPKESRPSTDSQKSNSRLLNTTQNSHLLRSSRFYFNATKPVATTTTTTTTTTTQKPFTGKPGCQADVVILVDLSRGTGEKRDVYVRLIVDLVKALKIGSFDTRVALVRYSGPGRTESQFHLNKHNEVAALVEEIESIQPMGGTTRTGEALAFALEEFSDKYARPKSERSIVVFTDGYSQDDPTESSKMAQRKGIHVYVIAVEDDQIPPDTEQLLSIATDKQSFFFSKEFSHLKDKFVRKNC